MIKATIKWMLDAKPLSNGKYAIYLRILKDRKRKNISIGLQCKKEHFINETLSKQHPNYQIENEMLLKFKSRALEIIKYDLPLFPVIKIQLFLLKIRFPVGIVKQYL